MADRRYEDKIGIHGLYLRSVEMKLLTPESVAVDQPVKVSLIDSGLALKVSSPRPGYLFGD